MNSIQLHTTDTWNVMGGVPSPAGGAGKAPGVHETAPRSQVDKQAKSDVNCQHCGQQLGSCQCKGIEPRYREGMSSMPGREAAGFGPARAAQNTAHPQDGPPAGPPAGETLPPPGPQTPRTSHRAVDIAARASAAADTETPRTTGAGGMRELTAEEQAQLQQLKERDREVRAHEQAHIAASGGNAGGASYTYQVGPDGRQYAVGGSVNIDTSPVSGDSDATVRKAQQVRRAALAPAQPSGQDRAVAAAASQMETEAKLEQKKEETDGRLEPGNPGNLEGANTSKGADEPVSEDSMAGDSAPDQADTGRRTRTTDWERALNAYAAADVATSTAASPTAVNVGEAVDAMQARQAGGRTGYGVPTGGPEQGSRLSTAV